MNFKNKYYHLALGLIYAVLIMLLAYWARRDHNTGMLVLVILFIGLPFIHLRKFAMFDRVKGRED
jgi:hypothetical protein